MHDGSLKTLAEVVQFYGRSNSPIVSSDGKWIVSRTPTNDQDRTGVVKAYPRDGGTRARLRRR
jgi:cytochrome c peroxidase